MTSFNFFTQQVYCSYRIIMANTKTKKAASSKTRKVIKKKPSVAKKPTSKQRSLSNRTGKLNLIKQKARQRLRTGSNAAMMIKLRVGSKNDCVSTPKDFFEDLQRVLNIKFKFDPCPAKASFDGLKVNWKGPAFINPPYSKCKEFIEKGIKERDERGIISAFLVPVRSDSAYWRELVWPHADQILWLKGRLVFQGYSDALPLSLAVIVFRPKSLCHKVRTSSILKGNKYEFVSTFAGGHESHIKNCPKPKAVKPTKSGCGSAPLELVKDVQSIARITFKSFHSSDWDKPWSKSTFVFPSPAGVQPSIKKAVEERNRGGTVALFIPVRSDTQYYHNGVFGEADQILYMTSHVHLCGQAKRMPVSMCVAIYRPHPSSSRKTQFVSGSSYEFVSIFPPK